MSIIILYQSALVLLRLVSKILLIQPCHQHQLNGFTSGMIVTSRMLLWLLNSMVAGSAIHQSIASQLVHLNQHELVHRLQLMLVNHIAWISLMLLPLLRFQIWSTWQLKMMVLIVSTLVFLSHFIIRLSPPWTCLQTVIFNSELLRLVFLVLSSQLVFQHMLQALLCSIRTWNQLFQNIVCIWLLVPHQTVDS